MNVLSLCDGMSCGQLALRKLGIPIKAYYASEIKDVAIKVTLDNFPNTIEIGDVRQVSFKDGILHTSTGEYNVGKIDLMMFGSLFQQLYLVNKEQAQIMLKNLVYSLTATESFRK